MNSKQRVRWFFINLAAFFVLVGCATLDPEEREYNQMVDRNNWQLCQMVYTAQQQYTISFHSHRRGKRHMHYELEADLRDNHCRVVIPCEYWESHIGISRKCND